MFVFHSHIFGVTWEVQSVNVSFLEVLAKHILYPFGELKIFAWASAKASFLLH